MKRQYRAAFRRGMIVRILALGASLAALAWSAIASGYVALTVVLAIAALLQAVALLRHIESHVRALEDFFAAVHYEDLTRRFVEEDLDGELKEAFNRILAHFQETRAERDLKAAYLETVVRHIPVPFVASRADGSLSLINNPARRLTGISALRRFDQFAELDPSLPGLLREVRPGSQALLQTRLRDVPAELRVSVAEIRTAGETERLYAIENLSGELTAREDSAWRRLIRVLTHEIMNTLTPVTSLAQTAKTLLDDDPAQADIREAVTTIARRSEGLMTFVARYRELLKVPQPEPGEVRVAAALQAVAGLMAAELAGVTVTVEVVPESLSVQADRALLDQVLVNLLKNAAEAMRETVSPELRLSGALESGKIVLQVSDNGPGITPEVREQVFIPFFTTKRDGSGVGLSLSRQIMTAHGGEIVLESSAAGTTVSLIF